MIYRSIFYKVFFYLLFFFFVQDSFSQIQDLTGLWEGTMATGEHLTICMKVKNNEICGYTADYDIIDPSSHCKANFRGRYDKAERVWVLVGTNFLENSGDHILMLVKLGRRPGDDANTLQGTVEAKYASGSLFDIVSSKDAVRLKRTSVKLPADMPDCFPKIKKPAKTAAKTEATIKPAGRNPKPIQPAEKPIAKKQIPSKTKPFVPASKQVQQKKPVPIKKDTANFIKVDTAQKKINLFPVPVPKEQVDMLRKMNARKNTEFSRIIVHENNITLNVYDNGVVDNDTVSIFYNGKLIAGKKGLSEKPLEIKLTLDEHAPLHEIVMFAENLGTIAPNTALIVVTVDGKRYELHSSASLTENAVLRFEYKPK